MVSQQPAKGAPRTGGGNSLNKVMIIGNLGGDPEMRFSPACNPVTSFSVAAGRAFNSPEGERREETEWFNVVTWNKTAELCNQFLSKGRKVYVEGRLHTRTWDGQDGQKHTRVEVIANQVLFLDRKPAASSGADEKFAEGEGGDIELQDIPF